MSAYGAGIEASDGLDQGATGRANRGTEDEFLELIASLNGPAEAGIGAGAERSRDPSTALSVGNGNIAAYYSACSIAIRAGIIDARDIQVIGIAGALINHYGWYDEDSNVVTGGVAVQAFAGAPNLPSNDVMAAVYTDAVTVIAATKVSWYLTNHHVGQGALVGYAKKVAGLKFNGDASGNGPVYHAMWALGHWAGTKRILTALDLTGNRAEDETFPTGADDIVVRLKGFPAGAAKVGVVHAILAKASRSVYALAIPPPDGLVEFMENYKRVIADPAKFHVGAKVLGYRRDFATVDDEILEYAAAYIHATAAGSTLAKAKTLPPVQSIRDNPLFALLGDLRREMVKVGLTTEEAISKIRESYGDNANLRESFARASASIANLSDE